MIALHLGESIMLGMTRFTSAVLPALFASALLATSASADTLLGVYAGVGQWQTEYSGNFGAAPIDFNDLNIDEETNNTYFIVLEHPLPILPNIRIQHVSLETQSEATLNEGFVFDDIAFPAGENAVTDIDLSHTDAVLYYEVLDNWVNLDLGLTLRAFEGDASVSSASTSLTETVELDAIIPMLYGKAKFDLPLTGWSIAASANLISYDSNSLNDYSAAIAYNSNLLIVFDLGVELGYRSMTLELDEKLNTDVELTGPYASFTVNF